ncbi:alpha/beta hydrolase [Zeaxanthinibacter enoshimensis]|uniref:Acetyl xylan esterase AXE1 n=1 Tax=Zeaxanthinibacter enoshimensis TaxID=392009 RepID=A0A4R6TRG3_9FLAO|nr:alpha/beta fold hydrolase [Zeaxanthinibacter enoshimensis]TDQ33126.1 acetyl xylan esterase AXE1 [Zeaxanthinibacter enoshimensis]
MKTFFNILLSCVYMALVVPVQAQRDSTVTLNPADEETFRVIHNFFEYDTGMPLDARVVERTEGEAYTREKIVFSGVRDSRVPGYLALPKGGSAPYPCVLLMHGVSSSKESWWEDQSFSSGGLLTKELLNSGIAVLTLDAEYHGERISGNDFEGAGVFIFEKGWMYRARDMVVQSVIEHRRALDYLATREDIDTTRLGIAGFSMGGMMVFNLAAVEPRVKVAVAAVTPLLKDANSALAVFNFAPYVRNTPVLMLMGTGDTRNYTREEAEWLHDLIRTEIKNLVFYESGHNLPPEWTGRAADWLQEYLK